MAAENKTEFLNKGSSQRITIDFNDKKHILTLGRDSPITTYCGGEFGINAQYPPPQTEPAARVKTANPEYKDTQQDLTGGIIKFRLQGKMQAFNCRFLSNSTKEW